MGKKSVRTALFLLPAAFCLLILFFRPHSLNQVRPVTGGDKADGVFCALETEAGKREGEDRRFLPAAQPVSFSVKAGYKNGPLFGQLCRLKGKLLSASLYRAAPDGQCSVSCLYSP